MALDFSLRFCAFFLMSFLRLRNANVMALTERAKAEKTFVSATNARECIKFLRVYILTMIMARDPNLKKVNRGTLVKNLRTLISDPRCA